MAPKYYLVLLFLLVHLLSVYCPGCFASGVPMVTPLNGTHQTAVTPDPFTLTFTVSPSVNPRNITWFFKSLLDISVIDDNTDPFLQFSDDKLSLIIDPVTSTRQGTFILNATNENGTGTASITLDVKSKPGFLDLPTSQKKLEQENVTFVCFPTGDPTPTVKWIFKNVFINTTNSVKYYIGHFGESDFGSLTILNLDFFDNGEYICHASNQFGALNTTAVQLDVQVPPVIVHQPMTINATAGYVSSLTCIARGFPRVNIYWQKNGTNITDIESVAVFKQDIAFNDQALEATGTLTITGSVLSTNGNYTCTASNMLKTFKTATSDEKQVFVQYPPSTSVTTTQVIVNQTYPANLTCQSFGIPPPTLQWYSNTFPVVDTDSINVTTSAYINATGLLIVVSELNISATTRAEHEANYTCVAVNGIMNYISSRQNATTELLVQVPPNVTSQQSLLGIVGENVTVTVVIQNASPDVQPTNINWQFKSPLDQYYGRINSSSRHFFSTNRRKLSITDLKHSDEGLYMITATNEAGSDVLVISLEIEAAPVITFPPINTNVLEHNDTTLNCTATSEPFSTFIWFYNVNPLNNLMTKYTVAFHNHSDLREYSSTLTVHNATIDDIGTYTCVVTNIHGTKNASVYVEVQVPPYITDQPIDTISIFGNTASLQCQAFGLPVPNITWLRLASLNNPDVTVISNVTDFTRSSKLIFTNLSFADTAPYICQASNYLVSVALTNSSSVQLTVNHPPVLKEAIVESVINQSQTVNMTCVYFGLPTPHVNWSRFDYNDLSNMEPKFIVYTSSVNASMGGVYTTSTLQVADVNETDTSNYTCTGVNQAHGAMTTADITTHSFEVLVQTSPIVSHMSADVQIGIHGQNITLLFKITRDVPQVKPQDIKWYRRSLLNDTTEILVNDSRVTFSNTRDSLTIYNLTFTDEGTYIVNATNIIGTGSSSLFLDIEVAPIITHNSGIVRVVEGEFAVFHCVAISEPVHVTSWTFNNTPLTNSSKYLILGNDTSNSSLTVFGVTTQDKGIYTCHVANVHGIDSGTGELQVQVPPFILEHPLATTLLVQRTATLTCCANGYPSPLLSWLKDNHPLISDNRRTISNRSSQSQVCSNLTITDLIFEDAAEYICNATNELAEAKSVSSDAIKLTVQYPPEVFELSQQQYIKNESDSFSIKCEAFGVPLPVLYWLPGPINITTSIGDGDQFLTATELITLQNTLVDFNGSRYFHLSNQCSLNDSVEPVCMPDNFENRSDNTDCNLAGSICRVPCGLDISVSNGTDKMNRSSIISTLTLCKITKSDELSYTCVAVNNISNNINTPEAVSANLIVQVAPDVISTETKEQIAFRDHNTTLTFVINRASPDVPPQDISWSFKDRFGSNSRLINGSDSHYVFSLDWRSLHIVGLSTHDTGTYTLTARNPAGLDSDTISLNVQALPEIINFTSSPVIATTNDQVKLGCFADGSPLQNVSWFFTNASNITVFSIHYLIGNVTGRSGVEEYVFYVEDLNKTMIKSQYSIHPPDNQNTRFYGQLTIQNITAFLAGNYQCRLANIYDVESNTVQVKVQLFPNFIRDPVKTICTAGGQCNMTCLSTGVPAPNITWLRNGHIIRDTLHVSFKSSLTYSQTLSGLLISFVTLNHSGKYHCLASNFLKTKENATSDTATLEVHYPPSIQTPVANMTVNETFTAILKCIVSGIPKPIITWSRFKSESKITDLQDDGSKFVISELEVENKLGLVNVTSTIMILNANKSDELYYRCTGVNGVANLIDAKSNSTATLEVQVPPTVFNPLSEKTYSKGEEVVISFSILRASPPVKVDDINWYFTGVQAGAQEMPLNISCAGINSTCEERYKRYNFSSDLTTLTISNTQVEDYGQFRLRTANAAGDNSAMYNLSVQVPAQLDITSGDTKNLQEGDNITLICVADGFPRPNIIWFFEETIINLKPRVTISNVEQRAFRSDVQLVPGNNAIMSSLTVMNVDREADGGRYVCRTSNDVGSAQSLQQPFILNITENVIDYCASNPCKNGGICFNSGTTYICECRKLEDKFFDGRNCERETTITIAPQFLEEPKSAFKNLFEKVTLNCRASGVPPPVIRWYKDNGPDPISFQEIYVIDQVQLAQRGRYYCTAQNVVNMIESTRALVNIKDVVEYTANLTIPIAYYITSTDVTKTSDGIVNQINARNAGKGVGNGTFFFIERKGTPTNHTANVTVPIIVTIRVQGQANEELRKEVEEAVKQFGFELQINENGAILRFNYCPPESTMLPSPDGNTYLDLVVEWPETLLGLPISLPCPCGFQITSTALIARRNCSGNFVTGAVWDSPNTVPCQFSITARRLCKLSELTDSGLRLESLDDITRKTENLDDASISVTSSVLDSVQNDTVTNNTLAIPFFNVTDNVLHVNRSILQSSQESSKSSSNIQFGFLQVVSSLPNMDEPIIRDSFIVMNGHNAPKFLSSRLNRNALMANISLTEELRNSGNYTAVSFSDDGLFISRERDDLVLSSVFDLSFTGISNLSSPLNLTFQRGQTSEMGDLKCVFWDSTLDSGFGGWSSKGCKVVQSTDAAVSCQCNHLTSFAILLDVSADEQRTGIEDEYFEYITYIGLTISSVCLIITLITYLGSQKLRHSEASQLLINLSFALLGLYVTFFLATQGTKLSEPVCGLVGVLVHYFFLVVFFIMAAEAVDLFIKLVIVLGPKIQHFILKTIIIAWIAPLFIVLFTFSPHYSHYINSHYCGPTEIPLYVGVLVPFLVVYIFNWTIFFIIMISLLKKSASNRFNEAKKKNRKAEAKQQCRVAFTVSVLFGLGWGFGPLATESITVAAIRIIFNSLFTFFTAFQGFFVFLLYVIMSPNARKVWKLWILRKEERVTEGASSAGASTTRSTRQTSLPNKASRYGVHRKGTLYHNVRSENARKTNYPSVSEDFTTSDYDPHQVALVEELKERLELNQVDKTFMNPLDDYGDVMSLTSDTKSIIGETTFTFPNPNPPSLSSSQDDDEFGEDEEADVECSTFGNPILETGGKRPSFLGQTRPLDSEQMQLLSQTTNSEDTSAPTSITIQLDVGGLGGSLDQSQKGYSQGPYSGEESMLIKS